MNREADIERISKVIGGGVKFRGFSQMKLVLFDADGTLVDSQAIIHETMRITFLRFGYVEPPVHATRAIIGLTLDRAIATILGRDIDAEVEAMTHEYKEIYVELAPREDMQCLAFDGMPQLVRELASRDDFLLGVVTGKSRRGLNKLFASNGFDSAFVVSRCADDCPSKPHPAMVLECCRELGIQSADTIVVGDTSFDMEMATAAGATALGVGWGYHPRDKMERSGAAAVVATVAELRSKIRGWANNRSSITLSDKSVLIAATRLGPNYA